MAFSSLFSLSRVVRRKMIARNVPTEPFMARVLGARVTALEHSGGLGRNNKNVSELIPQKESSKMTTTGQKRVLRSEKFSTFGWESSQRSPEASPLYPRNISPAFDETEATIFSFFGTKIISQGIKGQASDKRLPEFLEKNRDYSFGREDEDLVLSDPSSDEKDSDGSIEDSPALGHYNSSMGRAVALFPVALQNFEKKLKSAAKNKSEETHLELGNVKSHIITEPEKTSNVAKTKGKPAETRSQEQQEIMRMIHEKFEDDDVGNHLADFKSAIGGLEANQQRTSHQKLSAHFEGDIHTKLNNSVSKICKRTFSSAPPYKPVKPEIPTDIKPEDFPNVHGFVMKLQQYHSDYNITNMNNELKEKAYQLKLQEEYSAKAQAARDRNDTAGAEEYERLASEAGEKAEEHAGRAKRMADYEIYWRGKKAEYLKKKKEEEEKNKRGK